MNNIIWNEKERKYINRLILMPANMTFDENLDLVKQDYKSYNAYKSKINVYDKFLEGLKNIYYINDREQVENILNSASKVEVDPNNKFHYGLITSLSKINPKNHYEIFNIYKELIAFYEHTIYNIAYMVFSNKSIEDGLKRIKEIKNTNEVTLEEKLIKKNINYTLSFSNHIFEDELFLPLIESLNNYIKERLITRAKEVVGVNVRIKEHNKLEECYSYKQDFRSKSIKKMIHKNTKNMLYY